MDEFLSLETPEQIEINYDIARLGSRFIAALWDTCVLMLIQLMLWFSGALVLGLFEFMDVVNEFWTNIGIALLILLSFVLFWGYYVIFELVWNGQTLGKRVASIRTVRQDGYPIGFSESAIRNLVRVADFLPGMYGFGVVVMFIDKRSRRLGDFAAGTMVIHERSAVSLDDLSPTATLDTRLLEPEIPNLERLNADEVEAVRRFLQRREELTNSQALGRQLAHRFRTRLEIDSFEVRNLNDLGFLKRIVAQYHRDDR